MREYDQGEPVPKTLPTVDKKLRVVRKLFFLKNIQKKKKENNEKWLYIQGVKIWSHVAVF